LVVEEQIHRQNERQIRSAQIAADESKREMDTAISASNATAGSAKVAFDG